MFTPLSPNWLATASKRASSEWISLRLFSAVLAKWRASVARTCTVAGRADGHFEEACQDPTGNWTRPVAWKPITDDRSPPTAWAAANVSAWRDRPSFASLRMIR